MLSAIIEESIVITRLLEWQQRGQDESIQRFQERFEVGWNIEIHVSVRISEEFQSSTELVAVYE